MLYNFMYMKCPEEAYLQRQKVVARGLTANRYAVSFWDDGNVLELDSVMAAQHSEYTKKIGRASCRERV